MIGIAQDIERKGDDVTALAVYMRASELAPDDPGVLVKIGDLHARNRRYTAAGAAYQKAISLSPQKPAADALIGLGNVQVASGDVAAGTASLDRAAEVARTASQYNRLGVAQTQAGLFDKAILSYRKALESREDIDTGTNLALAMALAGRHDEAIELMERIVKAPTVQTRHKANYALILAVAGKEDAARGVLPESMPKSDVQAVLSGARNIRGTADASQRGKALSVLFAG
ncbi:pilus assembly protein TadD [Agaricicola taiwanensis]|uniref:Pilus assembly protein TadD n=1 Tax=Agaricicola taiwanensis TaxID=591372 RepID=A0A8J2YGH7_9RHOB|nr:pilus assembly protein TadD [Agaricicola taiwanensis]